jgi:hypothetical protein
MILNAYQSLPKTEKGAIKRTARLTRTPYTSVYKIVNHGIEKRKIRKAKGTFKRISEKDAHLIRSTIYEFYQLKLDPRINMIYRKLRGNNLINCSQKTLTRFVKTIGFSFKTIGKRNVLMESETIQKWRR